MLLATTRYLTATLNFLLAVALIIPFCLGATSSSRAFFPEEIVGYLWTVVCSLCALIASFFLILPRTLEAGLLWHKRVALLWAGSGIVYLFIFAIVSLRCGASGYLDWVTLAAFAVCALLWATPGWLIAALARRNPNAAQTA